MAPVSYEVLYYKRTNKVHKSKGVSKFDGVLSVDPETSVVTLEGDPADTRGKTGLYSGLQKEITRRDLQVDDIIEISGYQVEIVTLPNAVVKVPAAQPRPCLITKPVKSLNQSKKKPLLKPTILVKRKVLPMKHKQPLVPVKKGLVCRKPPAQPGAASTSNVSLTTTTILPHIPLPNTIRSALRPHQVTGIDFLWKTLHNLRGACCADEMGLGKSLMSIAILCGLYREQRFQNHIIVAPSSLTHHWCKEFDKWLGKASQPKRVLVLGGDQALHSLRAWNSSQEGKIIILSYELCRKYASEFQSASVGLLLVDEGHRLKNANGSLTLTALQSIPAQTRLVLTATPIQNNLVEFYAVANFCCPGILGDLTCFRRDFERPISAANTKQATPSQKTTAKQQSTALARITDTFLLRRLQRDILKTMLPPRTEALLFCQPSAEQRRLYQQLTRNAAGDVALQTLTNLHKICCHPSLLQPDDDASLPASGKLVVLRALLQSVRAHAPDDKVVVVSNFTSCLSAVQTLVLDPCQLSSARLDGTMDQNARENVIDTFQRTSADHTFCLLLSSKAGGVGLNLVRANRLVMLDANWNPALDIQAMGRVYRQGQIKECTIYRLFTAGTVEEIVYQRQTQKDNLSNLTVDQKHTQGRFTPEELKDCFTLKEGCPCDTQCKAKWPDYDGPERLATTDAPLLDVARSHANVLQYVHLVDDSDNVLEQDVAKEDSDSSDAMGLRDWDEYSSEEEF